ncbi:acetyl-CoA carboxylase carboxyltransferase subunit alpha [Caproiciproducens sp. CPB-2]|uniref:acetyl-CoA carboxylase carboxyltransferase subunit alpha n=1 Tax=Caproiciproducens sp. CPB-2 TaxID=3030017 RepID=UPI0023DBBA27|nr:acetyl-CoA carboxylase carboxyltransferase subunit alpha [Caproiciproducens sp. CPB-2]MDF1494634.1 acetyl-CoA carboxylase carboxyltransferase subunit alpha [Caproiciproducens sp. CPB-2]
MSAYDKVAAARAKGRPTGTDFIANIFEDFVELHGDRRFGDDRAVVAGIARLNTMPVTVVALERGHDTKEKVFRNFGSAHPEGYRKALRQMKLAEKFGRPVVCFVDTSGAFCGIAAEERGQGQAIAENLMEMMTLRVPVVSVLIGEGGSGGALALAVADEVWMLENAVYSVISPEGCASILWKDSSRVKEASECLKLTAQDLLELKVIERVVGESGRNFHRTYLEIKQGLWETFARNKKLDPQELIRKRYERFRGIGSGPAGRPAGREAPAGPCGRQAPTAML